MRFDAAEVLVEVYEQGWERARTKHAWKVDRLLDHKPGELGKPLAVEAPIWPPSRDIVAIKQGVQLAGRETADCVGAEATRRYCIGQVKRTKVDPLGYGLAESCIDPFCGNACRNDLLSRGVRGSAKPQRIESLAEGEVQRLV